MLPQAALNAWAQRAPWPNDLDIEQDLILSRVMIDIANHPLLGGELAFRGGTSLHKLHAQRPWRYSNDLDYVRTTRGPVGEIMDAIRDTVQAVGLMESSRSVGYDIVNLKFDAEPTRGLGIIRVKVEINTRETDSAFEHLLVDHEVDNPWYSGQARVQTFTLEELLGTKLRALYQRRKGRDLFDLWFGLEHLGADPAGIEAAFRHYLALADDAIDGDVFIENLDAKLTHQGFRSDLDQLLLAPPEGYSLEAAAEVVRRQLLNRL